MPEKLVVQAILKAYRKRGAYTVKIHGGPMQPLTIDILACYQGHFIGLEVKDGFGHDPTPRQAQTLLEIRQAGGYEACVHDLEEAVEILNMIDRSTF